MKIAVASQNRKEITGHTGRCRKFWIYRIEHDGITGKELLELSKEQSFHEASRFEPTPLDDVNVLICGGIGEGLARRLADKAVKVIVTKEIDPDRAIEAFIKGALKSEPIEHHEHKHR
ncbi:NifB/NifX family molybdenum-iron cluster-binding protein [Methylotuvimicrobium sp. KM2]|uniref:NifB/NifX family molybdenum-iron cluster-binding protein n=1 Tax=Methylotuvimicrobium sp. KM2 TaxID=3133976 RepID=UPI003100E110